MLKRAFQALKRVLMHVSGLPSPYFDFKKIVFRVIGFLSNYYRGTLETCLNVRFGLRNAGLCMSKVFSHQFLFKKKTFL